ncbi:hypothetical protein I6N95_19675 [Vagococcus sp. BWB3-3]|uniref:Serpin domain-containing protein n=1 Tax=Vagococcus allomyrinae TaxID=2794353 RepID=A0A940SWQ2_9ENTE|nr:serpin family protein [Vagococcus allomyrinae]MBP1043244.1 hypothetical protein [Vagococcus allomyrinae]
MKLRYIGMIAVLGSSLLLSGCMSEQQAASAPKVKKSQVVDSAIEKYSSEDRLLHFAAESSSLMLQSEGNQLYGPVAPYLMLSLLGEGAVGTTQKEVFEALYQTPTSRKTLHSFNEELLGKYLGSGDIKMANGLWLDEPVKLTTSFKNIAEEYYYGDINNVSFTEDPESAATVIAKWAAANSAEGIYDKSLIESGFAIVLLNSSSLTLDWLNPFDVKLTKEEMFYADGKELKTAMMHQSYASYPYAAGTDYVAISLPLKNGNRLQLILPNEGVDVRSLIDTKEKMLSLFWIVENKASKMTISIPKFRAQNSLDLQPSLEKMGFERAFSKDAADFSRLSSNVSLYLGRAMQNNRLSVEEDQVNGTAYTQVMMPVTPEEPKVPPVVVPEEPMMEFKLDRSFVYLISDQDGVPLLQGIVDDPSIMN